jgi:2-oxoglutarate dehydrogenase E1 component
MPRCTTRIASTGQGDLLSTGQPAGQAGGFQCFDSVLSEEAVLAFEYGYSTANPFELVVWEAQFGDFANARRWSSISSLPPVKPSGGAPAVSFCFCRTATKGRVRSTHRRASSAYMQLCAEMNMEVCQPSTPAQVFHMLRRQAVRKQRKPLIVFSPKSLLRHKDAVRRSKN